MSVDVAWEDLLAMQAGAYGDRLAYSWCEQGEIKASIGYSDLLKIADIIATRNFMFAFYYNGNRIKMTSVANSILIFETEPSIKPAKSTK